MRWISFCFLFLSSVNGFSWSGPAHEAVGIIAEQNLNPETKLHIEALMGKESLAKASVWPDIVRPRQEWIHTAPYHFINIPDGANYFQAIGELTPEQQKIGDIVRALLKSEDMLRDPKTSQADKVNAIRFITHFVGDLHQPLHVGYAEDRGGNSVNMNWYGKKTNLHSVLDSSVINTFADGGIGSKGKQIGSGAEYVELLRTPSPKEISSWQSSYVLTWVEESKDSRPGIYSRINGPTDDFYLSHVDLINDRVLQAGYRLAGWLNAIFSDNKDLINPADKLREEITKTLGHKYDEAISLTPETAVAVKMAPEFKGFFSYGGGNCDHPH
jgi:hypothetical protein